MFKRALLNQQRFVTRSSSSITSAEAGSTAVSKSFVAPIKVVAAPSKGSSFFQRFSAFMVGSGLGFSATFYFILEELRESNKKFESYLIKIESRIQAVEEKK